MVEVMALPAGVYAMEAQIIAAGEERMDDRVQVVLDRMVSQDGFGIARLIVLLRGLLRRA